MTIVSDKFKLMKRIKLKEVDLINLLTSLYTDAQMAIDGTWNPTYDKSGFKDQQYLIEQFCKDNNIELAIVERMCDESEVVEYAKT
jgi:hypothetical protein